MIRQGSPQNTRELPLNDSLYKGAVRVDLGDIKSNVDFHSIAEFLEVIDAAVKPVF